MCQVLLSVGGMSIVRSLRDERNDGVISCRFSMSLVFFCFGRFCWVYLLIENFMFRVINFHIISHVITYLFITPSGSSIIRRIDVWSDESMGAIEISRTALNLPQLFKCSFSKRKKFHTNLLKTSNGARIDIIRSAETSLFSVRMKDNAQINLRATSSIMAR